MWVLEEEYTTKVSKRKNLKRKLASDDEDEDLSKSQDKKENDDFDDAEVSKWEEADLLKQVAAAEREVQRKNAREEKRKRKEQEQIE